MPRPYFEKTPLDVRFYEEHLQPRMPARIFDVHVHLNLPEHVAMVPEERCRSDWTLESGHLLPVQDAYACAPELFPDPRYAIAGMPWPIREADLAANNRYLAGGRAQGLVAPPARRPAAAGARCGGPVLRRLGGDQPGHLRAGL